MGAQVFVERQRNCKNNGRLSPDVVGLRGSILIWSNLYIKNTSGACIMQQAASAAQGHESQHGRLVKPTFVYCRSLTYL
jgi:hypothetical protein